MRLGVREDRNKKFASTRRQNPLVLSQSAWVRLHAPFIRQHQQAEEQMHDDAYRKYLSDESDAMCAQWVDSVKNVRMRVNAARLEDKAQKVEQQLAKMRELDNAKIEKRQALCDQVKLLMAYEHHGPRQITSALLHSHVLKEREAQIEFKKEKERKIKEALIEERKQLEEDAKKFFEEQHGSGSSSLKLKRTLWQELKETGEERRRVAEENEKIEKDKAIEDIKLAQKVEEFVARTEKTAKKVFKPYDAFDMEAFEEKVAKEEAKFYAKREAIEQAKKEKIKKEFEERRIAFERCQEENKTQHYDNVMQTRWNLLNNFKQHEVTDSIEYRKLLARQAELENTDRILSEQIALNARVREERAKEGLAFDDVNLNYKDTDEFFLQYAKKVEEEVKAQNLLEYPVQKAIQKFKLDNGMVTRKSKYDSTE
ncbi:coiled-coil domain-containing protein 173-like [Ctenocephalides felis]|uniref:coiled-coil domain-containing protein 173-like n=1 Tax=Ctenocephalides felis TaxID=7515 RepID=UPI000E6E316D|nr:coiled-coil domain-containing protein 173-like [Ctenocephalides felis]